MAELPVILLAFANDLEGKEYLRDLPREQHEIRAVLESERAAKLCLPRIISNATLPSILAEFDKYGRRIKIFHYAGHAGPEGLYLESEHGTRVAFAEGLARFLGKKGVQLVFLNGCSTGRQALDLHAAGVDAVVATSRSIADDAARALAVRFYHELVGGVPFANAFENASSAIQAGKGASPLAYVETRDKNRHIGPEDITDDRGFPWAIHIREGAEAVERITLPELAGDPLLSVPALPDDTPLPPQPYRYLQPFTEEFAPVFFGRGQAIAELYHLIVSPRKTRVVLYTGPSGVGKSSVLDAGLLPRLKSTRTVLYARRNESVGLLGTFLETLRIHAPAGTHAADLAALWRSIDTAEKPLVLILDQAEEAFTRPLDRNSGQAELDELTDALAELFAGPAADSHGRVILGFRNEWLQFFDDACYRSRLSTETLALAPLSEADIVEVITGPTRFDALKRHYRLSVEAGLADSIAGYLLTDAGSALAPTLQALLSKMWDTAGGKGATFTYKLYDEMRDRGILLDDILRQGLAALAETQVDAARSGFGLEVLEHHTSDSGTAKSLSLTELKSLFPHRPDLGGTLKSLEQSYLLIGAEAEMPDSTIEAPKDRSRRTRLCHDTLAPLVQKEFRDSPLPGPRALRLLTSRSQGWKDGKICDHFSEAELKLVDEGKYAIRKLDEDEIRLIDKSRISVARIKRAWKIAQGVMAILFVISILTAGMALSQKKEAIKQTEIAKTATKKANSEKEESNRQRAEAFRQWKLSESRRLAYHANEMLEKSYHRAALLAVEAYRASRTTESKSALQNVMEHDPGISRTYHVFEGEVTDYAVGANGEVAVSYSSGNESGGVVLFDATGKRIRKAPIASNHGPVTRVAFDPTGRFVFTSVDNTKIGQSRGALIEFTDMNGDRISGEPVELTARNIVGLKVSNKGQILIAFEDHLELWDSQLSKGEKTSPSEGFRFESVAVSGDGTIAAIRSRYVDKQRDGQIEFSIAPFVRYSLMIYDEMLKEKLNPESVSIVDSIILPGTASRAKVIDLRFADKGKLYLTFHNEVVPEVFEFHPLDQWRKRKLSPLEFLFFSGRTRNDFRYEIDEDKLIRRSQSTSRFLTRIYRSDKVARDTLVNAESTPESFLVSTKRPNIKIHFDKSTKIIREISLDTDEYATERSATGPAGQIAMIQHSHTGTRSQHARFLDPSGHVLYSKSVERPNRHLTSIAVGPNSKAVLGFVEKRVEPFNPIRAESPPADTILATGIDLIDLDSKVVKTVSFDPNQGELEESFFGPDGRILVVLYGNRQGPIERRYARLAMIDESGNKSWNTIISERIPQNLKDLKVKSAAFGKDGRLAIGFQGSLIDRIGNPIGSSSGVVEYDRNGNQTHHPVMEVSEGSIIDMKYGPKMEIAVGINALRNDRTDSQVLLFGEDRLRMLPRAVNLPENELVGMSLSADGELVFGLVKEDTDGVTFEIQKMSIDPKNWEESLQDVVNCNLSLADWLEFVPDQPYRRTFSALPEGIGVIEALNQRRIELAPSESDEL